mmetsp:Transcript_6010/g.15979  ORF Transcript_6010/g.15979 Transcript_6010/m.15979 type:complete len:459 (+) Transcript_6010:547-1923(+)
MTGKPYDRGENVRLAGYGMRLKRRNQGATSYMRWCEATNQRVCDGRSAWSMRTQYCRLTRNAALLASLEREALQLSEFADLSEPLEPSPVTKVKRRRSAPARPSASASASASAAAAAAAAAAADAELNGGCSTLIDDAVHEVEPAAVAVSSLHGAVNEAIVSAREEAQIRGRTGKRLRTSRRAQSDVIPEGSNRRSRRNTLQSAAALESRRAAAQVSPAAEQSGNPQSDSAVEGGDGNNAGSAGGSGALLNQVDVTHRSLFESVARFLQVASGYSSQESRDLANELYRALVCKARLLNPSELSFPPKIEAAWQAAVLNTAAYRSFCEHVLGRFLEHETASAVEESASERCTKVDLAVAMYRTVWRSEPSAALWERGDDEPRIMVAVRDVLSNTVHRVKLRPSSLVIKLKEALEQMERIETVHQVLLFNSERLEDSRTLESYGIVEGSEISFMLYQFGS